LNSDLLQGFYLGDLLIEPLKGQVTSSTGARHLPPKAVEVLLCLANAPGDLVTREDLLNAVWGTGHGSREALGHAISEIRHALNDHPDDPHFIQTLPKRGYRLAVQPVPASEHTASIVIGIDNSINEIGLFENMKRRGVFETALAYLIVGWLLIQIADIVFSQLHIPGWAATFVTVLVIAGFPIALILSWFLEYRDGRTVVDDLRSVASMRGRLTRTYLSVIGALAAASVLVFAYDLYFGLPEPERRSDILEVVATPKLDIAGNAIAVLPFMNIDGSDETQIFANGFVDDVITRLSRVPGLLVSSRGDSFTLDPNTPSSKVRQRLRVAMYLEGSVQMSGDKIRVIVQLINSADGFHILSRTFDRSRQDFFAIRDDVTELTVSSLRVALPDSTQKLSSAGNAYPDLDAYFMYRRGIDELHKPQTATTISSALGWFDAALEVDPEYAAAHAGKCSAYVSFFSVTDNPASITDAERSCARALELNSGLDIVHTALGDLHLQSGHYERAAAAHLEAIRINAHSVSSILGLAEVYRLQRRPKEAEPLLRSAVGLQPGNWRAYNALGFFFFQQGRYLEAADQFRIVTELDDGIMRGLANLGAAYSLAGDFASAAPVYARAIDIEPQSSTYSNLGLMYYYLGRHEEAATALESGIELSPNDHLMWMNLGDVLAAANRHVDAQNAFEKAEELVTSTASVNPNDPAVMMDIAWINAMLGNEQEALDYIGDASAALPDDPYVNYIKGLIFNRFGNSAAAIEALELAVSAGYPRAILAAEPHLRGLHADPRFVAIIEDESS
jgi:TolB-like protein/DNA-binding winged helix-turn-helix (wHTH) protein/Flp pilus assembly protein TadD